MSDWTSPAALARELYEMTVSAGSRVIEGMTEIVAPKGQTALRLSREPLGSPLPRAAAESRPRPAPRPEPSRPPRKQPTVLPPGLGVGADILGRATREAAKVVIRAVTPGGSDKPIKPSLPVAGEVPRRSKSSEPGEKARIKPQLAAIPAPPTRPRSRLVAFKSAPKPYAAPIFEVPGAIRVEPDSPVQFDHVPHVFNPITSQYQALPFTPSFTNIPRENAFDFWFGKVNSYGYQETDANGRPVYKVDIYPYPSSDVEDTVPVTLYRTDPLRPPAAIHAAAKCPRCAHDIG